MLEIHQSASISRTYSKDDLAAFSALSGAPAHSSVPEPLIAALFSYLLGVELPGRGTNYLKQSLRFVMPAPLNEELTARVTITELRPDKHLVDLRTECLDTSGDLICEGRALVLAKDVSNAFA
ncbi:MAG: phosphate acetyltransferase [Cohaesibacter sp.]|jgi:acyl dehydratase|nr:phosphate acetyltransferase [Cohaesibacter sp.]